MITVISAMIGTTIATISGVAFRQRDKLDIRTACVRHAATIGHGSHSIRIRADHSPALTGDTAASLGACTSIANNTPELTTTVTEARFVDIVGTTTTTIAGEN